MFRMALFTSGSPFPSGAPTAMTNSPCHSRAAENVPRVLSPPVPPDTSAWDAAAERFTVQELPERELLSGDPLAKTHRSADHVAGTSDAVRIPSECLATQGASDGASRCVGERLRKDHRHHHAGTRL